MWGGAFDVWWVAEAPDGKGGFISGERDADSELANYMTGRLDNLCAVNNVVKKEIRSWLDKGYELWG